MLSRRENSCTANYTARPVLLVGRTKKRAEPQWPFDALAPLCGECAVCDLRVQARKDMITVTPVAAVHSFSKFNINAIDMKYSCYCCRARRRINRVAPISYDLIFDNAAASTSHDIVYSGCTTALVRF